MAQGDGRLPPAQLPVDVSEAEIRHVLTKILGAKPFRHSQALSRFLTFLVEKVLAGEVGQLKEYSIGVDVFQRGEAFDPRVDTIVRVQARELRRRLALYYETEGFTDPVLIRLYKGGYVPVFERKPGPVVDRTPPEPGTRKAALPLGWLALCGATAVAAMVVAMSVYRRPADQKSPPLVRITSDAALNVSPSISPDGTIVAYASDRSGKHNLDIWVKHLRTGETVQLTSNSANDDAPSFSHDGRTIAFRSERDGGGIFLVPTSGGETRLLVRGGRDPHFSPVSDEVTYWVGHPAGGGLSHNAYRSFIIKVDEGQPEEVCPEFSFVRWPTWLPDGAHILFTGFPDRVSPPNMDLWVTPKNSCSPTTTGARKLAMKQALGRYGTTAYQNSRVIFGNHLIFSNGTLESDSTALWRLELSPANWQAKDPIQRITYGTASEGSPSVSRRGQLVFSSTTEHFGVWSTSIENPKEAPALIAKASRDFGHSVNTDASRLTFFLNGASGGELFLVDPRTLHRKQIFASPPGYYFRPTISPDGSVVVYSTPEPPKMALYSIDPDGGSPFKICEDCGDFPAVSPDNTKVIYFASKGPQVRGLGVLDVPTGQQATVIRHDAIYSPSFSTDGKWVSFHIRVAPGKNRLYVAPFRGLEPIPVASWIAVSDDDYSNCCVRFGPDDDNVYFTSDRDGNACIWRRALAPRTKTPVGPVQEMIHVHDPRHALPPGPMAVHVSRDRLFFPQAERTGSIWMADLTGMK